MLLELLIVLAVLVVLVVFTVSRLAGRRMRENERTAIENLRILSSAEELYCTRYGTYGTLNDLEVKVMIRSRLARATRSERAFSGYYYIHSLGADKYSWCCIARPAEWGVTGSRNFQVAENWVIYYNETQSSNSFTDIQKQF